MAECTLLSNIKLEFEKSSLIVKYFVLFFSINLKPPLIPPLIKGGTQVG
jgi:hypothetical protein